MIMANKTTSYTNLTGESLLTALQIKGRLANGLNDDFTNEEIYIAVKNCKKLLYNNFTDIWTADDTDKVLSQRQFYCSSSVVKLLAEHRYSLALHELIDCIDDYGTGRSRVVTVNVFPAPSASLPVMRGVCTYKKPLSVK